MVVAGLTGGVVVALAVESEDKARSKLPPVAEHRLIRAEGQKRLRTTTPTTALMELWSSAQWGDVPAILRLQDPVVRNTIRDTDIAGVYQHQRTRMVTRKPHVVNVNVRGTIATVRYRLQGEVKPALPQLAIMRRRGQSWFLRYDTFIEEAIPFWVIASRGAEARPSRADRFAGASLTATYRAQVGRLAPVPKTETR